MRRWLILSLKTLSLLTKFAVAEGRWMHVFSAPLIFPLHLDSIFGKYYTFKLVLKM